MNKIVIGVTVLLGLAISGCSHKSDKETERAFHGEWKCEYYMTNDDMRMKVAETARFDTLTHKYYVEQLQELIYPVVIKYADVKYEGTWSADEKFLRGTINKKSVVNKLNSRFDENPEMKVYRDFVKDAADADMSNDILLIRRIEPDRIHLYDDDRDVAHDLVKVENNEDDSEGEII